MFEILRQQLKIQKNEFDPKAEIDSLIGSLLKERIAVENEVDAEERASILSDDYIINSVGDIFSAGSDPVTAALRWVIAYLVNHPEHQRDIQSQLDDVVGRDRMPDLNDLPKLPLILATIMESLRLGNVAPTALPHYTLIDTTLVGYHVPKDTVVMANLMAAHLDSNLWENPDSFDPRRHIDSDGQIITNSGNFLPISAGRRVCAGEALAKVRLSIPFISVLIAISPATLAQGKFIHAKVDVILYQFSLLSSYSNVS